MEANSFSKSSTQVKKLAPVILMVLVTMVVQVEMVIPVVMTVTSTLVILANLVQPISPPKPERQKVLAKASPRQSTEDDERRERLDNFNS